ncbi:hypothetical protein FRC06_008252 [Ceratobasidium sp. 370]|nr:hypothetical protein FRC06_008252 [Ceratobasidium sp. 370]
MIRAISVTQGTLDNNTTLSNEAIDIVTDRNNLRKLMRFICSNGPNRHRNRKFRIDAQLAPNHKTLVLTRYDERSVDNSTGFKGYGHNFEAAATSARSSLVATDHTSTTVSRLKATSYHRIIRYDFLGLRFMVRFEVDAMTDPTEGSEPQNNANPLANASVHMPPSEHYPTPPGEAVRAPDKQVEIVRVEGSELRHAIHGTPVPQPSLVELKTLKSKVNVAWSDVYPQLFLSQTPMAKVAKHVNGMVDMVQTYTNASEELQKAHADLSQDFRALVTLLTQMRAVSERYKSLNKPLSFYWTGKVPETNPTEEDGKIEITNVVTLGSYNWVEHSVPTIIIPGSPCLWKEPTLPLQLSPDTGPAFIDQNTARSPKSPFEPTIRAISVIRGDTNNNPALSDEGIDVVTDRNNLRKLMRFICANGPNRDPRRNRNREFRIDAQLAPNDKTLVLTRYDESTIDESTQFKGYGRNFEEAATKAHPPLVAVNQTSTVLSRLKTTGYHRIIRYDLLGLRFMVRFEVDAMTDDTSPPLETGNARGNVDDLADLFAITSISEMRPAPLKPVVQVPNKPAQLISPEGSELRHVVHGELVPQSSLVELTSLASKYEITWSDVYSQLFLSQTPVLKVAKHVDGMVSTIQTYTKGSEAMRKAHSDLSQDLRRLVALLVQMRAVVAKHKSINKPISFHWSGTGDLKVRTVERRGNLLSAEELAMF